MQKTMQKSNARNTHKEIFCRKIMRKTDTEKLCKKVTQKTMQKTDAENTHEEM